MVVIDTNILAYLLIEGDHTDLAGSLYERDTDWISESFILIEFSNILATYGRTGGLSFDQTTSLLNEAERRLHNLITIPHLTALRTAQRYKVSAYDARFLAVAEKFGASLVTEDSRLRTAAPVMTQGLRNALAAY